MLVGLNVGILLYFSWPRFIADSLLFACYSSCLHHAVDKSQSFNANDLIKTQRQTYAIRPTYPGQQLYKISVLKRSHDYGHEMSLFLEEIVLSTFICRTHPGGRALFKACRVTGPFPAFDCKLYPLQEVTRSL